MRQIPTSSRRVPWFGLGLAIMTLIATALIAIPQVRELANSNQGAASIFLSAALVLLYFGQFQLSRTQIQLENAAPIQIQQYEEDGNYLEIWLSNLGNGPAVDIELQTCIEFDATPRYKPGCGRARLRRVDEEGDYKTRVGNFLQAGEHNVRFKTRPIGSMETAKGTSPSGVDRATHTLANENVDKVSFEFFVIGKDLQGNEHKQNVYNRSWTINPNKNIRGVEDVKSKHGIDVETDDWDEV
jgi:hypothetical protein